MKKTMVIALAIAAVVLSCKPDLDPDPVHTHSYSTTWSKSTTQHWHECICGDKADVATHDWGNWQVTTAPTITTDGEETRTCATCGATETKPIAKLPSCECTVKVHPTPCTCPAAGTSACDCTEEQLEFRSEEITLDFQLYGGGIFTATVQGTFTQTQWNGVAAKIENALNGVYNDPNIIPPVKGSLRRIYENNDAVITVEETSEYTKYKVIDNNRYTSHTLYLNINALDNNLQSILIAASDAMSNGEPAME